MAKEKKSKKIVSVDGISIGVKEDIGLSLGALLGQESPKNENGIEKKVDSEQKIKNSEQDILPRLQKLSKVMLRRRTSGFGGKTVTQVTLPNECNIELEILSKELRKGLGCGSRLEEGLIFLQGYICDRAEAWFSKKGVKKVQID